MNTIETSRSLSQGTPLISIVVPVYNVEKYLEKCVQSIINQTYKNIEIILVDDGATDRCPQMCDEFARKDSRVQVIHKTNGGLVSARKAGFAAATGEYIMSVDSDDWIESVMCEELLDVIRKGDADFVASGYIAKNMKNQTVLHQLKDSTVELKSENASDIIKEWMFKPDECSVNSTVWGKLYKAKIIKRSYENVPDDLQLGEDFINFLNLMSIIRKFICVSKIYYNYIEYEKSMSHSRNVSEFRKHECMTLHCRNLISEKYNICDEIADKWVLQQTVGNLTSFNSNNCHNYLFRDIALLYNKNVIIYGAGIVGKDYYFQICKYENINIVGWVDKNYDTCPIEWRKIEPVESLLNKNYDYIIIAVKKEKIAKEIEKELLAIGVNQKKILWCEPSHIFSLMLKMKKIF